jgi:hypothetical protein
VWITPIVTATPVLSAPETSEVEGLMARMYYEFCVGQNEVGLSTTWDSSNLRLVESGMQPDSSKYWISEIADNVENTREAFVACKPESCQNQIYIKDNRLNKVYEIDWSRKTLGLPIQKMLWINNDILTFVQTSDSTHRQIIMIDVLRQKYLFSAVIYPKSNCPIATPTLTPLPSYPLKQILVNYTVAGFHTPYDLYFADYYWSNFVIYTDGQLIIPYQQKMLSKDEINQFLTQLEKLGFYKLDNEHLYNFGNQEPPKITDGISYCISVTGDRAHELCTYEPYESFLVPEMKNILRFLNDYQPREMSPYYPDRILLWIQVGRNPYATNAPKDAIPWTVSSISLETTTEKVIYLDGEVAKNLYLLYGDKNYFFTQNGKEYTVTIQVVLPHQELTNRYQ